MQRLDLLQETVFRIRGMTDTVLSGHDKTVLDSYEYMVCRLPAKGFGTLEFDMPQERMDALLKAGEAAMDVYFEQAQVLSAATSTS